MAAGDPPLLDLFHRLRAAGLELGVGEYLVLVRAFDAGLGLEDRAALLRLCQMIWAKSVEEMRLVQVYFDQIMKKAAVEAPPAPDRPVEPLKTKLEVPS